MTARRSAIWLLTATAATVAAATASQREARAFCGFYVSGAETKLTNDATQVVLMRDGTRTVLSMQNSYKGPPQDFALVVPVPVVLQKENVKTLAPDVFDHIDKLTAPRLVEYWEQDPCPPNVGIGIGHGRFAAGAAGAGMASAPGALRREVTVEAQFSVGEYDIVILSATDATALDGWLRQNNYKIPAGAEPYLRPYVQMGMKFFVAKVDISKVKFEHVGNGPDQAILSPLRFHYDSDAFNLPIRLGLINSSGNQDLIVTILARGQRYEVANYDNVAIPTNIDVANSTRREFGAFYSTLFDQTMAKHPHSVVTEYSWQAASCDPCPTPPLSPRDLVTLGADALPSLAQTPGGGGAPIVAPMRFRAMNDFVVTRLHTRYSKDVLGDDLFFRAAPPIVGGREFLSDGHKLEQGARPDAQNNFQARYVIRHSWTGPVACRNPQRGVWAGPPNGQDPGVMPAAKLGFSPRAGAVTLKTFVRGAVPPESFLSSGGATPLLAFPPTPPPDVPPVVDTAPSAGLDEPPLPFVPASPPAPPSVAPPQGGCAGCAVGSTDASSASAIVALLGVAVARLRRRRS
jgi:MYXO-CTERM domain-containing protein